MTDRTTQQDGFTIWELLIVIIVIVLLSGLVVFSYKSISQKRHNVVRKDNITDISKQLESFYSQNGYYPSFKNINDAKFRTKNLPNLHTDLLSDPLSPHNSPQLATKPAPKIYAYQVVNDAGASCETDNTTCTKYTLTATYEGTFNGATSFSKTSFVN